MQQNKKKDITVKMLHDISFRRTVERTAKQKNKQNIKVDGKSQVCP